MKVKIMTLIAAVAVLASCTNLRYTDYGKPFDFLKAKRDVVKPQGKVEVKSILVENNKKTEMYEAETSLNEIENTTIPTLEGNSISENETTLTPSQKELVLEDQLIEKTAQNKSSQSNSKTRNNITVSPFSKKVEQIVNTIIERISSEGTSSSTVDSDVMFIVALILAFLIPPLAVYLIDGVTGRFWLNLVLFLVGWGLGWYLFGGGIAFLCGLLAVVHALLIVLEVI